MTAQPARPPHEDPTLPPQLREALRIMAKRGPVVELTAPQPHSARDDAPLPPGACCDTAPCTCQTQAADDTEAMEKADRECEELAAAARAFRQQAEQTRMWGEQHRDRANRYRERLKTTEAERKQLRAELKRANEDRAELADQLSGANDENERLETELTKAERERDEARAAIARVRQWIAGDPVTAKTPLGDGYREALRDIADLLPAVDATTGR